MTDKSKKNTYTGGSIGIIQELQLKYESENLSSRTHNSSQAWWENWSHTTYDNMKESALWRAVLCRAITDAGFGDSKLRLEIATWVEDKDGTGDFDTVCHYAAVNEDFISRTLATILTAPEVVAKMLSTQLRDLIMGYDTKDFGDHPADSAD